MASSHCPRPSRDADDDDNVPAAAARQESEKGALKTMIRYPVIVLCCIYANIGIFMYGFDNITLSLCLSMPPFVEQFGIMMDGQLVIPAHWQSLWNAMPQVTTGIGAWFSGPVADRLGRRAAFAIAAVLSAAGVAVIYTAETSGVFLGGKMVNALGLGLALSTGQTYVSEITPLELRGIALSAYTFSQNLGFLVAASISLKRTSIPDASAYKVVFAAEWVWPALLLLGCPLIPESPYHLARQSKAESARRALDVLYSRRAPAESLDAIVATAISQEEEGSHDNNTTTNNNRNATTTGGGFADCFRGTNWRRTRIVLYANGLPQMIGTVFITNAPYFMTTAGLTPESTAAMTELGIGLAILSSFAMFFALGRLGRRVLVLGGVAFAALLYLVMGIASSVPEQNSATLWCTGITLQMVWLSVGPAIGPAMAVAGEVSAARLRARTMALGFLFNYAYSTAWNVAVPYMFNPSSSGGGGGGGLGGRTGWVFLATCLVAYLVVWLEMPDTRGLSFAEIDERFAARVGARGFGSWRGRGAGSGNGIGIKAVELGEVEQAEHAEAHRARE